MPSACSMARQPSDGMDFSELRSGLGISPPTVDVIATAVSPRRKSRRFISKGTWNVIPRHEAGEVQLELAARAQIMRGTGRSGEDPLDPKTWVTTSRILPEPSIFDQRANCFCIRSHGPS